MPRRFGSFVSKSWDLDSRLGGCRTRVIDELFFKFLEDKSRRFKTNLTLSLVLRFNLRLGLLHMECELHRTLYKRRLDNYSEHEHLIAWVQPRKYSEVTFKTEFGRTQRRLQKYSETCSTRLWRTWGLVRPGTTGLRTWRTYSRIRDGTWPTPYTNCNY
jgi:hypothetical protein